ncbi:MAG: DUF192 domain-containing protein [Verrucomicrobia bacterium]|jgi:uncharacterized protein|nr:DUF192 domain-containing protein [Verrucomicrobiota bacterium]
MRTAQLVIAGEVLVPQLLIADRTISRMRGLLGRSGLPEGTGMLLDPCSSIHTIGMRFSLDVIFLDRGHRVVRVVHNVQPNRFAFGGPGARRAVEVEAGWLDLSALAVGESLVVTS